MKIKFDTNGNRVLAITSADLAGSQGFSIQTLGNLPETHRNGVCDKTDAEVRAYLTKHGTPRQRELFGLPSEVDQKADTAGRELIDVLGLKLNKENRVSTSWGNKTPQGLALTVKRILEDSQL